MCSQARRQEKFLMPRWRIFLGGGFACVRGLVGGERKRGAREEGGIRLSSGDVNMMPNHSFDDGDGDGDDDDDNFSRA